MIARGGGTNGPWTPNDDGNGTATTRVKSGEWVGGGWVVVRVKERWWGLRGVVVIYIGNGGANAVTV